MNEEEWHGSSNLWGLLGAVQGKVSERKLLLVAVAGVRCCWERLNDDARKDLARMEAYLEGRLAREELTGRWGRELADPTGCARWIIEWVLQHHRDTATDQADLFRCVTGNPFRPCEVDPAWLAWEGGMIPRLAQTIHAERAWDRLPILADALEDAGCADEELLAHCRGEGRHISGCWVLDLVRPAE